jgi:WD40 repeat protein
VQKIFNSLFYQIAILAILSARLPVLYAQELSPYKTIETGEKEIRAALFSSDGKYIAAAGSEAIYIWRAEDFKLNKIIKYKAISLAACGTGTFAAAGADKDIIFYSFADGAETASAGKQIDYRRSLAANPDGSLLAGSAFSEILFFNAGSGKLQYGVNGHNGWIWGVCFSPDGKNFATGSSDGSVIIWNSGSRKPEVTIPGFKCGINSVKYSPDGKSIAAGLSDGRIVLLDALTGKEKFTLKNDDKIIKTLCFTPNGRFLISSGTNKTIMVWHAIKERMVGSRLAGEDAINEISASPDGKFLLSCGGGNINLWRLSYGVE